MSSNINNVNLKLSLTNQQHTQNITQAQHQKKPQQSRGHTQQLQSSSIPSINLKPSPDPQKHINFPPRYKFPPPPASQQKLSNSYLQLKYPPEISKISQTHITDNLKNPSRLIQPVRSRFSTGTIPQASLASPSSTNQSAHQPILHRLIPSSVSEEENVAIQTQTISRITGIQPENQQDMLKFVRKLDTDSVSSTSNNSSTTTATTRVSMDQNRHLQSLMVELRDTNQKLSDDNQELRDLCCFLDDDRQKGRKLAREWQRFGRYTATVMRQEVSSYQNKLRQLEQKQQELITDNLELKELCLYLDEERTLSRANALCSNCGATCPTVLHLRDDGDGSSSSTNADEPMSRRYSNDLNMRPSLGDQTLQYVRLLEKKIREMEENKINGTVSSSLEILSRPEAVVRALQVLEVKSQLEREYMGNLNQPDQMDDGEKALLKEMCNVVFRKLEETDNIS